MDGADAARADATPRLINETLSRREPIAGIANCVVGHPVTLPAVGISSQCRRKDYACAGYTVGAQNLSNASVRIRAIVSAVWFSI
jgi:hypothetical protein